MSAQSSVFLITSRSPKNKHFGTGFLIYKEGGVSWFLTCAHVVEDVGGEAAVQVGDIPAEIVAIPEESGKGPDLAVLKVQKDFSEAVLTPAGAGKSGMPVDIPGFQSFNKEFLLRPLSGRLGRELAVTARNTFERVDAWDLVIDGEYPIRKGYSGSPVIDGQSGKVAGVASHSLDSGEKGVAVSIGALPGLWPDMPDALRRAFESKPAADTGRATETGDTAQKTVPIWDLAGKTETFQIRTADAAQDGQTQPNYDRLLAKLCDRDSHEYEFWDFFCKHQDDPNCRNRPKFFIIHGNAGECHMSLVERLRQTKIRYYAENRYQDESALPRLVKAPVSAEKDLSVHQKRFQARLFKAVDKRYTGTDYSIRALCKLLGKYPVVMISHDIPAIEWKPHYGELLTWCMTDYWEGITAVGNPPLFLIFLNVTYPDTPAQGVFQRMFDKTRKVKRAVESELKRIEAFAAEKCPCLMIPEIGPVTIEDVKRWFNENTDLDESEWLQTVNGLFKDNTKSRKMVDIEKELMKIIEDLDRERFSLYTG